MINTNKNMTEENMEYDFTWCWKLAFLLAGTWVGSMNGLSTIREIIISDLILTMFILILIYVGLRFNI